VKHSVGVALVMKDDELVGIFSERDALFRLNIETEELGGQPISKFMTLSPQTLDINDKIAFALHKMDVGGYRHIPVVTDGRVTGVISVRDILRYISDRLLATTPA
jgi:CBS domain-containing protein